LTATPTFRLHPGVRIDGEPRIGEFCLIGGEGGDSPGRIGEGAVIRSHTVIYGGCVIGRDFQTGHGVLVREACRIGDAVSIGSHSVVEHHVTIGDGVRIHSSAFIPEFSVLEAGCWIGPNVVLTNARYPNSPGAKAALAGPVIGEGAVIGANVTVLPGVRIGRGALIGAGAVVVGDIEAGKVAVGNPARITRDVAALGVYEREALLQSPDRT
jgi:acetyltransferase-like isoleucine patch superfamily enzyme